MLRRTMRGPWQPQQRCGARSSIASRSADTVDSPQLVRGQATNAKAGDMKGDDRKAFMKTCLSAKPAQPAKPQSKMAECNAKTKGMSKADADKARSECMKG